MLSVAVYGSVSAVKCYVCDSTSPTCLESFFVSHVTTTAEGCTCCKVGIIITTVLLFYVLVNNLTWQIHGALVAATIVNRRCRRYADDTYILIPAVNDSSRQAELQNIAQWARDNNLKTNPAKFAEIVFVDHRKKKKAHPPPPLTGIARVTTLKILGVTFTNSLSVAEHMFMLLSVRARRLCML